MKKLLITIISVVLVLSSAAFAKAENNNFVVNPFTGESLGQASNIQFDTELISFQFNGKQYTFELTEISNEGGLRSYVGLNNGLRCVIAYDGRQYNINVAKANTSASVLVNDEDSLSIYVCSNERAINKNDLITNTIQETTTNALLKSQAYVHAVGPVDIPMLVSSGMAEGWLMYSKVSPSEYLATQVKYVTNSGSVQLFYEWQNSVLALA